MLSHRVGRCPIRRFGKSRVVCSGKNSTGPFGGDWFGEGHHRSEEFVRSLSMTIGWIHETQQQTRSTACPGEYRYSYLKYRYLPRCNCVILGTQGQGYQAYVVQHVFVCFIIPYFIFPRTISWNTRTKEPTCRLSLPNFGPS